MERANQTNKLRTSGQRGSTTGTRKLLPLLFAMCMAFSLFVFGGISANAVSDSTADLSSAFTWSGYTCNIYDIEGNLVSDKVLTAGQRYYIDLTFNDFRPKSGSITSASYTYWYSRYKFASNNPSYSYGYITSAKTGVNAPVATNLTAFNAAPPHIQGWVTLSAYYSEYAFYGSGNQAVTYYGLYWCPEIAINGGSRTEYKWQVPGVSIKLGATIKAASPGNWKNFFYWASLSWSNTAREGGGFYWHGYDLNHNDVEPYATLYDSGIVLSTVGGKIPKTYNVGASTNSGALRYRIADTSIATVDAYGTVTAVKVGQTRLYIISESNGTIGKTYRSVPVTVESTEVWDSNNKKLTPDANGNYGLVVGRNYTFKFVEGSLLTFGANDNPRLEENGVYYGLTTGCTPSEKRMSVTKQSATSYHTANYTFTYTQAMADAGNKCVEVATTRAGYDDGNYYTRYCSLPAFSYKTVTAPTVTWSGANSVAYGSSITVKASVPSGAGGVTYSSSNTGVFTVNSSTGAITPVKPGKANVIATVAASGNYADTTSTYAVTVTKGSQTVSISAPSGRSWTTTYAASGSQPTQQITASSNRSGISFEYSSSNTSVATVSAGGLITVTGGGSATITVKGKSNDYWNEATNTVSVTVNKAAQTVNITSTKDVELTKGETSAITASASTANWSYSSSNNSVATVANGVITAVGRGTAAITVKNTGNANYKEASSTVNVIVNENLTFNNTGTVNLVYGEGDVKDLPAPVGSGGTRRYSLDPAASNVVSYDADKGTYTAAAAGTVKIKLHVDKDETNHYNAGDAELTVIVDKGNPKFTYAEGVDSDTPEYTVEVAENIALGVGTANKDKDANLTYSIPEDSDILQKINDSGTYKGLKEADETVTVTTDETDNWYAASQDITVHVKRKTADIDASIKDTRRNESSPTRISTKSDGEVTVTSEDSRVEITKNEDGEWVVKALERKPDADDVAQVKLTASTAQTVEYNANSKDFYLTILRGTPTLTLTGNPSPLEIDYLSTDGLIYAETISDGAITYTSEDEKFVIAAADTENDRTGHLQATGGTQGKEVKVTASIEQTGEYDPISEDIGVVVKPIKPYLTAEDTTLTYGDEAPVPIVGFGTDTDAELVYTVTNNLGTLGSTSYVIASVENAMVTQLHGGTADVTISAPATANYIEPDRVTFKVTVLQKEPNVTLNKDMETCYHQPVSPDYDVYDSDGSAILELAGETEYLSVRGSSFYGEKAIGDADVVIRTEETDNYLPGRFPFSVHVDKAVPTFFVATPVKVEFEGRKNLEATSDAEADGANITYVSEDTAVAVVDSSGLVAGSSRGNTQIKLTTQETDNFYEGEKIVELEVTKATPTVKAEHMYLDYGEKKKITASTTSFGTMSYKSSDESIATVDENGVVTGIAKGSAVITVTSDLTDNYDTNWAEISVTVAAAKPTITTAQDTFEVGVNESFDIGAEVVSGAELRYVPQDRTAIVRNDDGTFRMTKEGTCKIFISADEKGDYAAPNDKAVTVIAHTTVPGTTDITAVSGEDRQVTVKWELPWNTGGLRLLNFKLERAEGDGDFEPIAIINAWDEFYVDTDRVNGITYKYRLYSENALGLSEASNVAEATPYRGADAPENLEAVAVSDTEIDVTWQPPADNGGAVVTGYRVRMYADRAMRTLVEDSEQIIPAEEGETAETVYSMKYENLTRGTEYTIAVDAVNSESENNAKKASATLYTWNVTAAPAKVKADPQGVGVVQVSWEEPAGGNGAELLYYTVEYRKRGTSEWIAVDEEITETSYLIENIEEPDDWFYFRVKATNEVGESDYSKQIEAFPAYKPDAPQLNRVDSGDSGAYISASVNKDNDGRTVTAYGVYYKLATENDDAFVLLDKITTYTERLDDVFVEGLTNGIEYDIAVTAINDSGESELSVASPVTPGRPTKVRNLRVTPRAGMVVNISFDPSQAQGGKILSYFLRIKSTTNGVENVTEVEVDDITKIENEGYNFFQKGTLNGDSVSVTVTARARLENGKILSSDESDVASATIGAPSAPVLTKYIPDEEKLALEWTESDYNGNSMFDYTVTITDVERAQSRRYIVDNGEGLENGIYTLDIYKGDEAGQYPFEPGRKYEVSVFARNSAGNSQLSNVGSFTYMAPTGPTNAESTMEGDTMTVTWTKPDMIGGSEIIAYNIYLNDDTEPTMYVTWEGEEAPYQLMVIDYREGNNKKAYGEGQNNLEHFSVAINNLAIGYSYNARVSAINEQGEGVSVSTGEAEATTVMSEAPNSLRTKAISGTEIELDWKPPYNNGGSDIDSYTVKVYEAGEKNFATSKYNIYDEKKFLYAIDDIEDTSITIDNLTSGKAYAFTVTAQTGFGESEESAFSATTRTHTKPSAPVITALSSGVGGDSSLPLTVKWDEPEDLGESNIVGYDIYVDGNKHLNLKGLISPYIHEYTVKDVRLVSGKTYNVTVVAYNEVTGTERADGVESEPKSVTMGTIAPPEDLKLKTELKDSSSKTAVDLTVSWDKSQYEDIEPYISSFYVYVNGKVKTITKDYSVTYTDLDPTDEWTIEVSVMGVYGEGHKSNPKTITLGAPRSPEFLKVWDELGQSMEEPVWFRYIEWENIEHVDNHANGYNMRYRVYVNGELYRSGLYNNNMYNRNTMRERWDWVDSPYTLKNGETYNIYITAYNDFGESLPSKSVLFTAYGWADIPKISNVYESADYFSFDFEVDVDNGGLPIKDFYMVLNTRNERTKESLEDTYLLKDGEEIEVVDGKKVKLSVDGGHVTVSGFDDLTACHFWVYGENERTGHKKQYPSGSHFGFWSYAYVGVPRGPVNIKAIAGDGKATIEFDRVDFSTDDNKIVSYQVMGGMVGGTPHGIPTLATVPEVGDDMYSCEITGLENGKRYAFYIRPVLQNDILNADGQVTFPYASDHVYVTPGTPTAPIIRSTKTRKGEIDVNWYAPRSENAGKVLKYYVYLNGNKAAETPVTNITLKNLTDGEDYEITVTAVNYVGEGDVSDAVTATPGTVSDAVTDVKGNCVCLDDGEIGIELTWEMPVDMGGTYVTDYKIIGDGVTKIDAANRKAVITGLEPGESYSFEIIPINKAGEGKPYITGDIKTINYPSAPTILGGDSIDSSLKVKWTAPESDGGAVIDKYVIYARPVIETSTAKNTRRVLSFAAAETEKNPEGTVTWEYTPETSDETEMTVSFLSDSENGEKLVTGQQYDVSVVAVNVLGKGEESDSNRMQVVTGFEQTVPGVPENFKAVGGDGKVMLSWKAPTNDGNSTIKQYRIMAGSSEGNMSVLDPDVVIDGYTFSYVDTNVTNGVKKYYKIKAINGVSTEGGEYSEIVSATPVKVTPPDEPTWPELNNETGESAYSVDAQGEALTLVWNESQGEEQYGAISYKVMVNQKEAATVTEPKAVLTGLNENQRYRVQVVAFNEAGGETPSDAIWINTGLNVLKGLEKDGFTYEKPYLVGKLAFIDADYDGFEDYVANKSVPTPPQNIELTHEGKLASITWEASDYDGEITGYNVYIRNNLAKTVAADGDFTYTFEFEYGKTYWAYVKAYNDDGESAQSEVKFVGPYVAPPTDMHAELLGDKAGGQANEMDIALTWTVPNTEATSYVLYVNGAPEQISAGDVLIDNLAASYTYTATVGKEYNFAVSSKYDSAESNLAVSEDIINLRENVPVPQNLEITNTIDNKITLAWTLPVEEGQASIGGYVIYVNGDVFSTIEGDEATLTTDVDMTQSALVRIAAVSVHETEGDWSNAVKFRTAEDAAREDDEEEQNLAENAPTKPSSLTATVEEDEDGNKTVEVTWEKGDEEPGKLDPDHYDVYVYTYDEHGEKTLADGYPQSVTDGGFEFTPEDGTDYEIKVVPVGKDENGEDVPGKSDSVVVSVPKDGSESTLTKPILTAVPNAARDKAILQWNSVEGAEKYNLIVNGNEDGKTEVELGEEGTYEYPLDSGVTNYNFVLEAVKGEETARSAMVTVNTNSDESVDDSYLSNPPVITGAISNGVDKVKIFWTAPEERTGENGEIAEYKIMTTDGEVLTTVPASASPLMAEITFENVTDEKNVVVQTIKKINGADFEASTSDAWNISPQRNIVSDEDYKANNQDAKKTNPDEDGDGEIDKNNDGSVTTGDEITEFRIPVEISVTGAKADIIDENGETVVGDIEIEMKEDEEGKGEIVVPADKLNKELSYSVKIKKVAYTSYIVTDIPYEKLSEVGIEKVEIYAGDLNGDGRITSTDSVKLTTNLSEQLEGEITDEFIIMGDLNGDGRITSTDSVTLSTNMGKGDITVKYE